MPARTRHGPSSSAATTTEAVDRDQPEETETAAAEAEPEGGALRKLQFNEPITWRVGRSAIPIAELLQRLQTLAQELRKLEQEEVDTGSLTKVSQELATPQLLAHKDKGVRAWVGCCVVDVLRLCAPDAPFTGNQLKDIFTCIVSSIIPALADPSHPYNAQHIYVLNSLAEVKSIVLMTDLDHPDSLIVPLFTTCFDIVSGSSKASTGEEIAKNVEFDMTRLLVTVIDESPVLAPEVVDVIVAQFLRVDPRALENPSRRGRKNDTPLDAKQGTLLLKDYPSAYNMSKAICQACPERMTSHISQYFNNVIIDASAPGAGTNGSSKPSHRRQTIDDSDEEGEDFKELSKAHRLIRELWRACPEVLQNVVPQLEAELSAESVSLRLLATQTIGDLTAGIGVAGPPPPPPMDPAAYPPVSLVEYSQVMPPPSVLLTPMSPKPFSQAHSSAYDSFLSRRLDKSASVRAAWATVVGLILLTSAGGSGLSEGEERTLIKNLATMLRDADERVRVAAVDAVGTFGLSHVVYKLGFNGGFSCENSTLAILAERVKDRKPQVREHAMKTLARMWAVAAGEIEQNNEQVVSLLKDGPSRIFDAYYTNDPDIHVMIDKVLFELLIPLSFPPIKSKLSRSGSSQSQKQKDLQASEGDGELDVDKIRARRILTLLAGLDDKAKKVFFAMQARQLSMRTLMTMYLQACEDYNGGVIEGDDTKVKAQLGRMVDALAKAFPDPSRASADLWKFAKVHDRRNYQLIRFSMAAHTDYRTVIKAIKELMRRMQNANNTALLETFVPLLYRSSSLIFNRSHIPAIMSLSRTDENGLANPAHEMLREISSRNPAVLEAQVREMCKDLESQAPTPTTANDAGTEEILKACSGFAKKLPEKLPKERKFLQALTNHALYSSSPHAAKHAVTILMATADKKEMYAKDLVHKCVTDWTYESDRFLTKLAALSKLNHLAPREADEERNAIVSIAIDQVLLTNRSSEPESDYKWSETVDEETSAKEWALKIIVNRLRAKKSADDEVAFRAQAEPVYSTLNKLIDGQGELSKKKDTPATQKPRLRLAAAKSLLKLCASHSLCDHLLGPRDFNSISLLAQDRIPHVRSGFIEQLKKKLVQNSHLSHRWYIVPCLLAFEPDASLKDSTLTWLRSRAAYFSQRVQVSGKRSEQQMIMESIFSRLLSLLAYHPDYPPADVDESTKLEDLTDFARYILFYLSAVGNERNLSLIFHVAQRVKQTRDGITKSDEISTRLHTLSDLAQSTIRRFAEIYSQQHKFGGTSGGTNILQTYPGKMGVSSSLFAPMSNHREAQEVAEKNFLPEDIEDTLDRVVRVAMKPPKNSSQQGQAKKRKPEAQDANGESTATTTKKPRKDKEKTTTTPSRPRRTSGGAGSASKSSKKKKRDEDDWSSGGDEEAAPKKAAASTSRRRSSRSTTSKKNVSYIDRDSDEDDMEMDEWEEQPDDPNENDEGSKQGSDAEEQDQDQDQDEDEGNASENRDEDEEQEEPAEAETELPPPATKGRGKATPSKESHNKKKRGAVTNLPTRRSSRRG